MVYSDSFLQQLFSMRSREVYGRITSLAMDETPQETIEGRTTAGSVSVDGASTVRRTCQLTLVTPNTNISDYLWGLNTKFSLEIGLKNTIDNNYPDIIWFKQGIYIITSFSSALSTTGYTINLSGKDKMCMLNGENGGLLPMEVDFGTFSETDKNGNTRIVKYPLKDIIREAVHHYGGEPFHNIIINDLDNIGKELLEYKLDTPMYLIRNNGSNIYFQGTLNGDMEIQVGGSNTTIGSLPVYDSFIGADFGEGIESTIFTWKEVECQAAKIIYGQTMGYSPTEMTYTGELIAKAGESITSVLDKIKQMLGNYEYFYDLDGRFIFQEQKNYINTAFSPIEQSDGLNYVDPYKEKVQFSFVNSEMFTTFNNTPNLSNLKNDFSVWGTRKGVGSKDLPIHMRYAIDTKPLQYTSIAVSDEELQAYNEQYGFNLKGQESVIYSAAEYDWRELIYQMAIDYRKYNHLDDFNLKIVLANPQFSSGTTGYEPYYVDMEGFWRQLYNPTEEADAEKFYQEGPHKNWAIAVYEASEQLNFWFDMLDTQGELAEYAVSKIGSRPKVDNNKDVKAIYYRETPEIIYDSTMNNQTYTGYSKLQIPENYSGMFSQSTQGKSAKDVVDNLLYNHAYCVESISVTSIPVYSLEPNKRIYIFDKNNGIDGEYLPSKFSIPLTYNGTMNITAIKAVDRII